MNSALANESLHKPSRPSLPTAQDVASFSLHGWWVSPVFLTQERLDAARAALERVYAGRYLTDRPPRYSSVPAGGDTSSISSLGKIDNAWWSDPVLAGLATDPYVGACTALLLRTQAVRLWQDQLLYKPGGGATAGNVGWHQDWQYWNSAAKTPDLLTAWIALDDVDEANGAMQVIPGSHRLGLVEGGDFFHSDRDSQIDRLGRDRTAARTLVMKAGQMSFHHCLTLHGSGPNTTDRPRRSLAVHLMSGGLRSTARREVDSHYNLELLLEAGGAPGDPYEGPLWPQVHPQ